MRPSIRWFGILGVLSALLVVALNWWLVRQAREQDALYSSLAWSLRRGGDGSPVGAAERAYLQGNFAEALRLLGKAPDSENRDLKSTLFLCLLYDLPWPQQVLSHRQLDSSPSGRPRLLARVVQTGYLSDVNRVRLDLLGWDGQEVKELHPPLQSPHKLNKEDDFAEVMEMISVKLDRKDNRQTQLWVSGRARNGRFRLDIVYGFSVWKRWVLITDKPVKRQPDRVWASSQDCYKLVDDEWIEVR